jgi:hypothetical protein
MIKYEIDLAYMRDDLLIGITTRILAKHLIALDCDTNTQTSAYKKSAFVMGISEFYGLALGNYNVPGEVHLERSLHSCPSVL